MVFIATSVDGYIARDDHDIGWLTDPDPSVSHPASAGGPGTTGSFDDLMSRVDHIVMGRGTYEKVLTFDEWPYPRPVLVLSTTLETDDSRVSVVRSIEEAVEALNDPDTRGVYVDGGRTIQAFLRADLIDEITVTRAPVLIGSGIPLFGSLDADIQLSLQAVDAGDGYLHARYDVVRSEG